ncbi:hypothetical protein SAMN05216483_6209 [Streptomyces sp. 2131.1]|nr:hypothetical protein SAMN05216483_6209 [Streptomyces sp. 2131.1]
MPTLGAGRWSRLPAAQRHLLAADGSWVTLYLGTSYPSADRLWHLADDNTSW